MRRCLSSDSCVSAMRRPHHGRCITPRARSPTAGAPFRQFSHFGRTISTGRHQLFDYAEQMRYAMVKIIVDLCFDVVRSRLFVCTMCMRPKTVDLGTFVSYRAHIILGVIKLLNTRSYLHYSNLQLSMLNAGD